MLSVCSLLLSIYLQRAVRRATKVTKSNRVTESPGGRVQTTHKQLGTILRTTLWFRIKACPVLQFYPWFHDRRSLSNLRQKFKSRKKNCRFFPWNLFGTPRDISWHHWKTSLTSKGGHSGGSNFLSGFWPILLKTSVGSRGYIFQQKYKCHTILESSWQPH